MGSLRPILKWAFNGEEEKVMGDAWKVKRDPQGVIGWQPWVWGKGWRQLLPRGGRSPGLDRDKHGGHQVHPPDVPRFATGSLPRRQRLLGPAQVGHELRLSGGSHCSVSTTKHSGDYITTMPYANAAFSYCRIESKFTSRSFHFSVISYYFLASNIWLRSFLSCTRACASTNRKREPFRSSNIPLCPPPPSYKSTAITLSISELVCREECWGGGGGKGGTKWAWRVKICSWYPECLLYLTAHAACIHECVGGYSAGGSKLAKAFLDIEEEEREGHMNGGDLMHMCVIA